MHNIILDLLALLGSINAILVLGYLACLDPNETNAGRKMAAFLFFGFIIVPIKCIKWTIRNW